MAQVVRTADAWQDEIARWIRSQRAGAGLTQVEVARAANVSLGAVKALEQGRGSTLRTFVGVLRALNLDGELDRLMRRAPTVDPMSLLNARTADSRRRKAH